MCKSIMCKSSSEMRGFLFLLFFFFSSRRRHTRSCLVSWARKMCIRDSRKRNRHDTCRDAILENCGYLCLLYTSDAADDLLCVDLGGRRIIKKKKTK